MAKRGRPRTSNAEKFLKGTAQPCRLREVVQFEQLNEIPNPTTDLGEVGYYYWQHIAGHCVNVGMLESIDVVELEHCCIAFKDYWEFDAKCKDLMIQRNQIDKRAKELMKMESDDVAEYILALYKVIEKIDKAYQNFFRNRKDSLKMALDLSAHYGMNPRDRQNLEMKPKEVEVDPVTGVL